MDQLPDVDIAIIGGGIGGIYTGWRLLTSDVANSRLAPWAEARGRLKVTLFEGSDRIGGRLLSARSPHMPDSTAEMGGMRYVSPAQQLVQGLVEDALKLSWHEQTVAVDGNIAFLRGKLLRLSDLGSPDALPYWLDPSEAAWLSAHKGQSPASLIGRVLLQMMPGINTALQSGTLRKYLSTVEIDGMPLWKHGLWNLLAKGMSRDGYRAAQATIGYDCLGGNWNAFDLTTEYFDFTPGVSYRMVDDGYERVPWELQSRFKASGGEIGYHHWLDGFVGTTLADGSKGVQLRFHDGKSLTARAIVLALPRRSIELLKAEGEVLDLANHAVRHDLASVSPIPLFKLFLLYPQCWWQDAGVTAGRSLTDMPLRQCYYWPAGPSGREVPQRSGPGLIMAYDDLLNVGFWNALDVRHQIHGAHKTPDPKMSSRRLPTFVRAHSAASLSTGDSYADRLLRNWADHSATRPMVQELHRQLMLMHGVDSVPEPIDAAYMDWTRDPYGGAVHFWNVGYQSEELLTRMTQPMDGFPCYICGEAYSTNQTWAEGALQTAEIVLQQRLGLAKPEWQHD